MAAAAEAPGLCPLPTGRAAAARGRQAVLWNRARRLRRRLRALQARQVERHVRHQLAGLARYLGPGGPGRLPPAAGTDLRLLAAGATARLRATQGACDSDATGSSSGSGEESEADGAGQRSPAAASPGALLLQSLWETLRVKVLPAPLSVGLQHPSEPAPRHPAESTECLTALHFVKNGRGGRLGFFLGLKTRHPAVPQFNLWRCRFLPGSPTGQQGAGISSENLSGSHDKNTDFKLLILLEHLLCKPRKKLSRLIGTSDSNR
ncbi:uncharacterized protein LJ206_009224 isoform 4-T5 [Theristicus caerulescens]